MNYLSKRWSTVTSFSAYYNQCAPISCSYTFVRRNNTMYALTTLISLYGELTVILRLCVPRVVHWCHNRVSRSIMTNARMFLCLIKYNETVFSF
jgi:hypothetical protein